MALSPEPLFTPFTSPKLQLKNRIVMAPMTRMRSPDGVPGQDVADYYRRRAENDVALIITEGTVVDHPAANGYPQVPYFHGEKSLAGWANVVKAVHDAGGKIFPQLWHVGSVRKSGMPPDPTVPGYSPSGLAKAGGKVVCHEMTKDDIRAVVKAFGDDFPVCLRWSQWKQQEYSARLAPTPEELAQFLQPLSDAGVDIFHCSTRRYWLPEFDGSDMNVAGWTKQITGKPVITVGSIGLDIEFTATMTSPTDVKQVTDIDPLLTHFNRGEFDLVCVGRALLADPAWAVKMRAGKWNEVQVYTKGSEAHYF